MYFHFVHNSTMDAKETKRRQDNVHLITSGIYMTMVTIITYISWRYPSLVKDWMNDTIYTNSSFKKIACRIFSKRLVAIERPLSDFMRHNVVFENIVAPLMKLIKPVMITMEIKGNFGFLFAMGRKRNWQDTCSICLDDEHIQNVMFRPCGHAFCDKCFVQLCPDGEKPQFKCPNCRAIVQSVFVIDETFFSQCIEIRPPCSDFVREKMLHLIMFDHTSIM